MFSINRFFQLSNQIINDLEKQSAPLHQIILILFSSMIIRFFLEILLQTSFEQFTLVTVQCRHLFYFSLVFLSKTLSLLILLYYVVRLPILSITRVLLPYFSILLLIPLAEGLVYWGEKYFFHCIHNVSSNSLSSVFEIIIASYGILSYVYYKKKHWPSIIISLISTFLIIFFYDSFAIYLKTLIHGNKEIDWALVRINALFIFISGCWLAYLVNPLVFSSLLKDMRWLRMAHYQLMLLLGCCLAIDSHTLSFSAITFSNLFEIELTFILTMISIQFAGLFSIVTNNLADQAIDCVSNPSRPLTRGIIHPIHYARIGWAALCFALSYALLANVKSFIIISVTMATYYLYSMPPVRFKRVFILSKCVISLNSLLFILLGFLLLKHNLLGFPKVLLPIYLIGFTLTVNFIDLKDHLGDRYAGIITLPGLIGLKKAKHYIGISFFITYLSFYFLIQEIILLPFLIMAGSLHYYFLNQKKYCEKKTFLLYLISLLVFISSIGIKYFCFQ